MEKNEYLSKRDLQAIQTKENLLKSGRIVFLKRGFKKATMTQVNKVANTGYGTAYVYFKNKDDLFMELMESTMKKMFDVAGLAFKPKTKQEASIQIKKQARLFMTLALQEREMMQVVNEAIGISGIVQERWSLIRSRFITEITEDIQYVQEIGLAEKTLHAPLIAKGWFYLNEQLMWELVLGEIDSDIDVIVDHLTYLYMNGLYS